METISLRPTFSDGGEAMAEGAISPAQQLALPPQP